MGILVPMLCAPARALERRRVRRATWAFNHELDAYARKLSRIEGPAGVTSGDPSTPMPRRAAEALPRMRREHARFRKATAAVDEARDVVLRRLADPKTPPAAAATARGRFDQLAARHPAPARIAAQEALWEASLARLERWAERDPEYAAAAAVAVSRRQA
jgi:hypothetical protein